MVDDAGLARLEVLRRAPAQGAQPITDEVAGDDDHEGLVFSSEAERWV